MSEAEINRMVQEAERFKNEDEANKAKGEAKNGLENNCFQMRKYLIETCGMDK